MNQYVHLIRNSEKLDHLQDKYDINTLSYSLLLEKIPKNAISFRSKKSNTILIFDSPKSSLELYTIPNYTAVIIWKEIYISEFKDYFALIEPINYKNKKVFQKGWSKSKNFIDRKYNIIITTKLDKSYSYYHKYFIDLIKNFGSSKVAEAFDKRKSYSHLSLIYDKEISGKDSIKNLLDIVRVISEFSNENKTINLNFNKIGITKNRLSIDLNKNENYSKAKILHQKLINKIFENIDIYNTETISVKIPRKWHSTIFLGNLKKINKSNLEIILKEFKNLGSINSSFNNITIMVKVGNLEPYKAYAIPAFSFFLN